MKNFNLHETRIQTGFTAPDSYFDNFKITLPSEKPVVRLNPWPRWASVAAVLVLALSIPALNKLTPSYPHQAVEQYLVYNAGLHEEELIRQLDYSDLEAMGSDFYHTSSVTEQMFANEDIEYLIY